MPYLLNLAYAVLLLLAAPWFLYQALFRGKYRQGFAAKFLGSVPPRESNRPCIWLHAVSVGEVNLLSVLLKHIAERRPDVECVISTTTATGYALAQKKYASHTVFYCPLDFSWAVRRAMHRICPSLLVLAELELWPNLIRVAKQHGAKVAIINGRLSANSFRGYRRIRMLLRTTFTCIDLVAAQNEEYADRFRALGFHADRVYIAGSLKFDGAQTDRANSRTQSLQKLVGLGEDDIVFLAGSTQAPEERLALDAFKTLAAEHPRLKLIIVPRHPHRFDEVASILDDCHLPWQRRSLLSDDRSSANSPVPSTAGILLVDTIGELGAWWGAATVGFVGGSLFSTRGGQNMIEPAGYGVATCFGPNTQNFRDVVEMLLTNHAAVRVKSREELTNFVQRCLDSPTFARDLARNAIQVVLAQQGAVERTWKLLDRLLIDSSERKSRARRAAA